MNEISKDQRSLTDYAYEIEMLKRAGKRVCTMPGQGAWCNDCKQYLFCDIRTGRKPYQVIEEKEIEMNEEKKHTIAVEMITEGFEEAGEKIEVIADALDQIPATVNIKAKDCEVNVHTTNIIEPKETFETYAPGGVIRTKPDYEPESEMIDRLISKISPLDREKELIMLKRIKNRCKCRNECEGCWYYRAEAINGCELSGRNPKEWIL